MKAPITLTETARTKLRALCHQHHQTTIKLGVRPRGCSGHSYHMDFAEQVNRYDEIIQLDDENRFAIDANAIMMILGTEIDWVVDGIESKFSFTNPRAVSFCGCGESFTLP